MRVANTAMNAFSRAASRAANFMIDNPALTKFAGLAIGTAAGFAMGQPMVGASAGYNAADQIRMTIMEQRQIAARLTS